MCFSSVCSLWLRLFKKNTQNTPSFWFSPRSRVNCGVKWLSLCNQTMLEFTKNQPETTSLSDHLSASVIAVFAPAQMSRTGGQSTTLLEIKGHKSQQKWHSRVHSVLMDDCVCASLQYFRSCTFKSAIKSTDKTNR